MKSLVLALLLGAIVWAPFSWAQTPPRFEPRVTAAMRAPYYFTMLPAQYDYKEGDYEETAPARGVAYRLEEDGNSASLWEVEGWYATTVYLAANGTHLIRMGNWPEGNVPEQDDLAVAFYKEGELLKSYSTADLVGNPNNVRPESDHYFWLARDENYPELTYSNHFLLKTIENKIFEFDISTGDIIGTMAEAESVTPSDNGNLGDTVAEDSTPATSEPRRLDNDTLSNWNIRQDGPASFSNVDAPSTTPRREDENGVEILDYRP